MELLYIADQNDQNQFHLHGSQVCPPVVGSRRQDNPPPVADGLVEEIIELALHGEGIAALVKDLEETILLSQNRIKDSYLYLQTTPGGVIRSARIQAGRIELLAGGLNDRKRGVQILRLRLTRADYWEEFSRALALSNQNGREVWEGLTIRNHCDATSGHQNFVDAAADEVHGTQPCPAEIRIVLPPDFPAALLDCYIAAGFNLKGAGGAFEHVLEGEAGSPGSGCTGSSQPADATCSGGSCARAEWTAQSEIALWNWTLSATQLNYMWAGLFRPVMRLAALPSAGIYLRWSVRSQSGGELLRTAQAPLDPGRFLAPLPALRLPPEAMGGGAYQPLEIHLLAESAAQGTKSLQIDFVHLLPAGSIQHLRPLGGLAAGNTLVSDSREGRVYAFETNGGGQHLSHLRTGGPIQLQPGRENRIYFLFETAAGAPVDAQAQVMIFQRARVQQP
jgi:hypothetical protein